MAIAEVGSGSQRQTNTGSAVDSINVVFPGNVTSGSLLAVGGACWDSPASTSVTVTDTLSTTYTTLLGTSVSGYTPFIAYGIAGSSAACTVTVSPNDPQNWITASIDEFSGVDTTTPLDVDGGNSTGTSAAPSDGITTGVDNALLLGVHTTGGSVTRTPGSGFTEIGEVEGNGIAGHNFEFQIVTTAGAYTVDWTVGSSTTWCAMSASFKPSGGGGGPTLHLLSTMGVGK